MSEPIKKARSVGGVILIVTLSAMFMIEMLFPELHVDDTALITMTTLISALLGIDVAVKRKGRIASAIMAAMKAYSGEDDE